ncbi:hypothetical protein TNCV_4922611 [Trichonephila clavipes]|nr:hypothetical protein TNCV_4922611 [Trichonephila clavipes]
MPGSSFTPTPLGHEDNLENRHHSRNCHPSHIWKANISYLQDLPPSHTRMPVTSWNFHSHLQPTTSVPERLRTSLFQREQHFNCRQL